LKIKNYKFEGVANFKYLGVILDEDNKHQIDLQEGIKNSNKTYFILRKCFKNKTSKKTKTKEHDNTQNVNICFRNLDTNKDG
jgi:hypothetical protein